MIASKDRLNSLSRGVGSWMLGASVCALALAVFVPMALAQQAQPKSSAAPKKAPTKKAPKKAPAKKADKK